MKSLQPIAARYLRLETQIVAFEKKKDSLPTLGHNVPPGARHILRGFSMSAFFRNSLVTFKSYGTGLNLDHYKAKFDTKMIMMSFMEPPEFRLTRIKINTFGTLVNFNNYG